MFELQQLRCFELAKNDMMSDHSKAIRNLNSLHRFAAAGSDFEKVVKQNLKSAKDNFSRAKKRFKELNRTINVGRQHCNILKVGNSKVPDERPNKVCVYFILPFISDMSNVIYIAKTQNKFTITRHGFCSNGVLKCGYKRRG
jgi:hypothetical protein